MFALFVAYFLYGVTQTKVSQRPPISINKLQGLERRRAFRVVLTSYSFNRLWVLTTKLEM